MERPQLGLQSEAPLDVQFDRYFAAKQVSTDVFGMMIGAVVYMSLVPSLAALHRPDLVAAAIACVPLCLWPLLLSRLGPRARAFYLDNRDYLLMVHSTYHYSVGGQFANFVRLNTKLSSGSTGSFMAGFILSSTVPWQAIDALMYRMRYHRFVLAKPLVLLSVLPLERRLCQLTCASRPGEAPRFRVASGVVRLLLGPFLPLPQAMAAGSRLEGATVSCLKVQAFLLVMLCWLLPAMVLRHLEKQARRPDRAAMATRFLADIAAAEAQGGTERRGDGPPLRSSAASAAALAGASLSRRDAPVPAAGAAGPAKWADGWLGFWNACCLQLRSSPGVGCEEGEATLAQLLGWPSWALPTMVATLCWHTLDALL